MKWHRTHIIIPKRSNEAYGGDILGESKKHSRTKSKSFMSGVRGLRWFFLFSLADYCILPSLGKVPSKFVVLLGRCLV